jgi:hypothetical protein
MLRLLFLSCIHQIAKPAARNLYIYDEGFTVVASAGPITADCAVQTELDAL